MTMIGNVRILPFAAKSATGNISELFELPGGDDDYGLERKRLSPKDTATIIRALNKLGYANLKPKDAFYFHANIPPEYINALWASTPADRERANELITDAAGRCVKGDIDSCPRAFAFPLKPAADPPEASGFPEDCRIRSIAAHEIAHKLIYNPELFTKVDELFADYAASKVGDPKMFFLAQVCRFSKMERNDTHSLSAAALLDAVHQVLQKIDPEIDKESCRGMLEKWSRSRP